MSFSEVVVDISNADKLISCSGFWEEMVYACKYYLSPWLVLKRKCGACLFKNMQMERTNPVNLHGVCALPELWVKASSTNTARLLVLPGSFKPNIFGN